MIFRSKYQSKCATCGNPIAINELISWDRNTRKSSHAACSEEGREAQVAQEQSRAASADITVPAPAGFTYLPYQLAGIHAMLKLFGDF